MLVRGIPRHFRRVQVKRSKSESLIQVADLVARAILQRDAKGEADAFDYIERKMSRALEFRG